MEFEAFWVHKRTKMEIRKIASKVREMLRLPVGPINASQILDQLSVEFAIDFDLFNELDFEGVDDNVEAFYDPAQRVVFIRDRVYAQIDAGVPRGRFTIAHELGHAVMGHQPLLYRQGSSRSIPYLNNSEVQANLFAAEFLMPLDQILASKLKTAEELQRVFGTSHQASKKRLTELQRDGYL